MRKGVLLMLGLSGSLVAAALLWLSASRCLRTSAVKLPYRVAQTPLVVAEVRSYDGLFLEDGSGRCVQGIAAVVLHNTGDVLIQKGVVQLLQGQQRLVFTFSMLPPGEKVLALERSAKPFAAQEIDGCWGWSVGTSWDLCVQIQEVGRTMLSLHNMSGERLEKAYAYFKRYDPDEKLYVGGVSYCVGVDKLLPGYRVTLPAYGYLSGSSKVIE